MKSLPNIKAVAEDHMAAHPGDSLYLLIDHAGMHGLRRKLEKVTLTWASLFDETRESGALSVAPILILIGRSSSLQISKLLIQWISEQAAKNSSVIVLASRLPIDELKDQLTSRLDVKLSENMDAMLRFFDPRVFENLLKILTDEQIEILCAPARKWWYVDRMGEVVAIERECEAITRYFRPLELSEEQEFSLISASEPDQVMHILMKTMPQLEPLMPTNQYRFIMDNIRSASKFGLHSASELALYSAMVTLRGANFEALPYWEVALADVRAGRISFADAVAESEDVAWED